MKVAIIGAGWVGCHLSKKLKVNNNVDLYEKNEIFSGSSFFNQNRLHLGYHYSRSYNTRNLCKTTFNKFYDEYSFLVENIEKNVYSIPINDSLIDFTTYLKIFEDFDSHRLTNIQCLKNIEGSILVDEKYINPIKSKEYFKNELSGILKYEKITKNKIEELKKHYDLVINATNNNFLPIEENTFSENCIVLLYKKLKETEFDSLTLVDGKLMSIYPYNTEENLYSLTDVEFTPHGDMPIDVLIDKMQSKVVKYYPDFLKDFVYHSYKKSVKYKIKNLSDTRVPLIKKDENVVSCFTGKIQGIYFIEEFIEKL